MTRTTICLSLALSAAQAGAQALTPGIPAFPFNPSTTAAANGFVDNTAAAATDTNNPYGTATKPRRTIPTSLPAGAVVQVRGGPYTIATTLTISAQGTASKPVILRGVGSPMLQGATLARLILAGTYVDVEGFVLDRVAINMSPTIVGVMIRNNVVRNYTPTGNSAAIAVNGQSVVVYRNEVHHNGNSASPTEIDIVGVFVLQGASGAWIVGNSIHHNGSDAVLVGSQSTAEPWPQNIYVAANILHEDRENGVDIKNARDVVVSNNTIYGYQVSSSSSGEAIVTHYTPERIWIVNNRVLSSNRGIVCTGASTYVVMGNLILNIHHSKYETYSPTSLYASAGIITYNTYNSFHINNTIWFSDAGISLPGGIDRTQVEGNIIGAGAHHIAFGSSTWMAASVVDRNLLSGMAPRFLVSGALQPCIAPTCLSGDPKFADPAHANFRPMAGSPAINADLTSPLYTALEYYYGGKMTTDATGAPRPVGPYDIGAVESQ